MFPDSEIAKKFALSETKVKYVVQFAIAPYLRNMLIADSTNQPFSFAFDETTTNQVKKQYNGYIRYYSKVKKQIISRYVHSLFLGHCEAKSLKDHFVELLKIINADVKFLLQISMDGPHVNLAFHSELEKELQNIHDKRIINIGTCSLHQIHTAFMKGLSCVNFDYNQFAQFSSNTVQPEERIFDLLLNSQVLKWSKC